jgi:TonB family protein
MSGKRMKLSIRTAVLLMLIFAGTAARADLYSGQVAYAKKDYATAFNEFKQLAELGQPKAQYNLAVMYALGQGAELSKTYAHAWASLAKENGEPHAGALVAELEPQLTPNSLQFSADLQLRYSTKALNSHLMPVFLRGKEYEDRDPPHMDKPYRPEYPLDAQRTGTQGEVYVDFVIPPDGHPRIPRILYAVPAGVFDQIARYSIMRTTYLPARARGIPISVNQTFLYRFVVIGAKLADYKNLQEKVKSTLAKAEEGDAASQMLYGMMLSGLPQLKADYTQALPWFLKAAQAGAPWAQYQIGSGLLEGRGCQCDTVKGEIWLLKAAQSDESDAQVTLAEHLLHSVNDKEALAGALVWLERAAKQDNDAAKLYLSAVLAANSEQQLRDPKRALALTNGIRKSYGNDPSWHEIRAAAAAALGDYRGASREEDTAIETATILNWDLTLLKQRQSIYQAGRPWTGDLFAF